MGMKRKLWQVVRICTSVALLIFVLYKADLFTQSGREALLATFTQVNVPFLIASILIGLLLALSSSIKWYMLLRSRGLNIGLWRLYVYYIIGKFYNLILPTSLGGDVVRANELGKYTGQYADSAASVFVERFTGMVTLLVLAVLALVFSIRRIEMLWMAAPLSLMAIGLVVLLWILVDERILHLAQRIVGEHQPIVSTLFKKAHKFQGAVAAYKSEPMALRDAFINSLIFYLLAVLNVWFSAKAFGAELRFLDAIVAVPLILVIMNLPISIGGIGLMEFAYTSVLGLFGVPAYIAISTVLLMRAKSLIYAGLGGVLHIWIGAEKASEEQPIVM